MLRVLIEEIRLSITRGCKEYIASFVEGKREEDWQEIGNPKWKALSELACVTGYLSRCMPVCLLQVAVISFSTDT